MEGLTLACLCFEGLDCGPLCWRLQPPWHWVLGPGAADAHLYLVSEHTAASVLSFQSTGQVLSHSLHLTDILWLPREFLFFHLLCLRGMYPSFFLPSSRCWRKGPAKVAVLPGAPSVYCFWYFQASFYPSSWFYSHLPTPWLPFEDEGKHFSPFLPGTWLILSQSLLMVQPAPHLVTQITGHFQSNMSASYFLDWIQSLFLLLLLALLPSPLHPPPSPGSFPSLLLLSSLFCFCAFLYHPTPGVPVQISLHVLISGSLPFKVGNQNLNPFLLFFYR